MKLIERTLLQDQLKEAKGTLDWKIIITQLRKEAD